MQRMSLRDACVYVLAFGVLQFFTTAVWASPLSEADMYLDPALVPSAEYLYAYEAAGYTADFIGVKSLQVLPPLTTDGSAYYFSPTVDYIGDITGTDGSITFNRPGPYFVLATYNDDSTAFFDYGIEFQVHSDKKGPTYNWKKTDTPGPDVVMTDPDVAATAPDFPSGTTEINNKATWAEVTAHLKTLTNKHVELNGHGNKGQFNWNGSPVLFDNTQATKDWLNSMKGHVNNLTFMSCLTGAGTEGDAFLQLVANTLGEASGYTECVGGNGTDWFINGDGVKKTVVPEPATAILIIAGGLAFAWRTKRAA